MRTLLKLLFERDMSAFDFMRIVAAANLGAAISDSYGLGAGFLTIVAVVYGTGWISGCASEKWGRE